MLIEFQVENFGSIRERQALSLVASKPVKEHQEANSFLADGSDPKSNLRLLRSAVVYGANAAGKSNLVRGLFRMQQFVLSSDLGGAVGPGVPEQPSLPKAVMPFVPFKLDEAWKEKPSRFEATFVLDGVRHQYGFALDRAGVNEEWLVAYPKGRPQTLFERGSNQADGWYLNRALGPKTKDLVARTRKDALFVSVGARWNHPVLSRIYEWFKSHVKWIDNQVPWDYTILRMETDRAFKDQLLSFLRLADLDIVDVQTEHSQAQQFQLDLVQRKAVFSDGEVLEPRLLHKLSSGEGSVAFHPVEESLGTVKYLTLAGPWLDVLANGYTLVMDELETHLHPLLAQKLVEIFHSPKHNPKNAQLIFTTHLPLLMDTELMRRDQIWFVEKNNEGASSLYPLTDFSPRKQEAIQKGYLAGRYGAVPMLGEETD